MKLLAIETSTDACSAALLLDGQVRERFEQQPRMHGKLILGMMDELLAEAGIAPTALDALAFGRGPGSFTGVRIATGVAQGVAFGADIPLLPISTLAALAQGYCREQSASRVLAAFDARMGELYWGAFTLGADKLVKPMGQEQVAGPQDVVLPEGAAWQGVGQGWASYGDELRERLGSALLGVAPQQMCRALDVALLGAAQFSDQGGVSPEQGLPVYLRDQVAWKKQA